MAAVLAVVAVLATAAVVAGVPTRPATRLAVAGRAPVAAVLDAAAVRAAHGAGAGRPPGPGQYLYVNEVVAKGLGSGQGCPEAAMTVRAWVAADGSGRQIGTFPAPCGKLGFDETYQAGGLPWWLYGYVKARVAAHRSRRAAAGDRAAIRARPLATQRHVRLRRHVPERRAHRPPSAPRCTG